MMTNQKYCDSEEETLPEMPGLTKYVSFNGKNPEESQAEVEAKLVTPTFTKPHIDMTGPMLKIGQLPFEKKRKRTQSD